MAILIDKRIQRFVEGYLFGENNEIISIHLKDVDETFWFENEVANVIREGRNNPSVPIYMIGIEPEEFLI